MCATPDSHYYFYAYRYLIILTFFVQPFGSYLACLFSIDNTLQWTLRCIR